MVVLDIFVSKGYIIDRNSIRATVEKTLKELKVDRDVELSVSVVDEIRMRKLHKKYMGTDKVTDVLSFPTGDPYLLGDIVICYPVTIRLNETIEFLVDHGLKHLLGIHHD